MAKISRLGGAVLAATEGTYYLVGDLKGPLEFASHGFEKPEERDVCAEPYIKLKVIGEVKEPRPVFTMPLEGEALAKKLVRSFMIYRNGSVSERLWELSFDSSESAADQPTLKEAQWLALMPDDIWDIIRDNLLRCI